MLNGFIKVLIIIVRWGKEERFKPFLMKILGRTIFIFTLLRHNFLHDRGNYFYASPIN